MGLPRHPQQGSRDTDLTSSFPPSVLILQVAEAQTRCNWAKAGEHPWQVASPLQGGHVNKKKQSYSHLAGKLSEHGEQGSVMARKET